MCVCVRVCVCVPAPCIYVHTCTYIYKDMYKCTYLQLVLLYAHELAFFTFLRFSFFVFCFCVFPFLFANVASAAAHHDEHFFIQADNYI